MQVQSENGSVIISNIAAKHVSTNAQNPGPSGSAVIERENYFILIISISKNYFVEPCMIIISYFVQCLSFCISIDSLLLLYCCIGDFNVILVEIWHQGTKFWDEL